MRRIVSMVFVAAAATWIPAHAASDEAVAAARASLARIQALRAERPGDGVLAYYQSLVHASIGERDAAVAELRGLLGRRLGLIPVAHIGFEPVWNEPAFQAVRQQLADEEARTRDAPVVLRLPDAQLIPEGIAHDPVGRRHYVGSIAQRKIVVVDAKARVRDFSQASDRLDAVLGLAVDAKRRQLLAVSTNGFEDSAKLERRNAVLRYDLASGRRIQRLEAPDAMQLNDLAIAADGTLYVTDSASHSLFRAAPGDSALARVGAAGGLRGANGIAIGSGGALYVTLSTGIARVDPATAKMQRLPQPDNVMTGGIDGLYWHRGDLVGVQNSTNPGRVIRIALADGGTRIAGVTVLQSHHHPLFVEPTTGTVVGGALHVIANSHVLNHQPDGTLRDVASLRPTAIVAVPLGS
jgi:sugar lactone lactonase YvrE